MILYLINIKNNLYIIYTTSNIKASLILSSTINQKIGNKYIPKEITEDQISSGIIDGCSTLQDVISIYPELQQEKAVLISN